MKKLILVIVLIIVLVVTLPVFADSSKSYDWKIGFNTVEDSVTGVISKEFKRIVEEKTNGRITITIYPSEMLGSAAEMVEAVKVGAQTFALPGNGVVSPVVEEYGLYCLPFMFLNFEEALAFTESEIAKKWDKKMFEKGYKVLTVTDCGFSQITNNKRPIYKADDIEGILLRGNATDTLNIEVFKQLGASITTMPYSELYMGLQTGVVEGQFNPVDAIYESKFYEVQDYLSIINIQWYANVFIMNKQMWLEQDAETQEMLLDAARQAREVAKSYSTEKMKGYLKLLKDEFKTIAFVADEDKEGFKEKLQPLYKKWRSQYPDVELMEKWIEDYRKSK